MLETMDIESSSSTTRRVNGAQSPIDDCIVVHKDNDHFFPNWIEDFNKKCLNVVGTKCSKKLYKLMTSFILYGRRELEYCAKSPSRAYYVAKNMYKCITFFYMYFQDVKDIFVTTQWTNNIIELLVIFCKLEIKSACRPQRGKENDGMISTRIMNLMWVCLDHCERNMIHVLLKMVQDKYFTKKQKDIFGPIFRKLLTSKRPKEYTELEYIRTLLAYKTWKRVMYRHEKKEITDMATHTLKQPASFLKNFRKYTFLPVREPVTNLHEYYVITMYDLPLVVEAYFAYLENNHNRSNINDSRMDKMSFLTDFFAVFSTEEDDIRDITSDLSESCIPLLDSIKFETEEMHEVEDDDVIIIDPTPPTPKRTIPPVLVGFVDLTEDENEIIVPPSWVESIVPIAKEYTEELINKKKQLKDVNNTQRLRDLEKQTLELTVTNQEKDTLSENSCEVVDSTVKGFSPIKNLQRETTQDSEVSGNDIFNATQVKIRKNTEEISSNTHMPLNIQIDVEPDTSNAKLTEIDISSTEPHHKNLTNTREEPIEPMSSDVMYIADDMIQKNMIPNSVLKDSFDSLSSDIMIIADDMIECNMIPSSVLASSVTNSTEETIDSNSPVLNVADNIIQQKTNSFSLLKVTNINDVTIDAKSPDVIDIVDDMIQKDLIPSSVLAADSDSGDSSLPSEKQCGKLKQIDYLLQAPKNGNVINKDINSTEEQYDKNEDLNKIDDVIAASMNSKKDNSVIVNNNISTETSFIANCTVAKINNIVIDKDDTNNITDSTSVSQLNRQKNEEIKSSENSKETLTLRNVNVTEKVIEMCHTKENNNDFGATSDELMDSPQLSDITDNSDESILAINNARNIKNAESNITEKSYESLNSWDCHTSPQVNANIDEEELLNDIQIIEVQEVIMNDDEILMEIDNKACTDVIGRMQDIPDNDGISEINRLENIQHLKQTVSEKVQKQNVCLTNEKKIEILKLSKESTSNIYQDSKAEQIFVENLFNENENKSPVINDTFNIKENEANISKTLQEISENDENLLSENLNSKIDGIFKSNAIFNPKNKKDKSKRTEYNTENISNVTNKKEKDNKLSSEYKIDEIVLNNGNKKESGMDKQENIIELESNISINKKIEREVPHLKTSIKLDSLINSKKVDFLDMTENLYSKKNDTLGYNSELDQQNVQRNEKEKLITKLCKNQNSINQNLNEHELAKKIGKRRLSLSKASYKEYQNLDYAISKPEEQNEKQISEKNKRRTIISKLDSDTLEREESSNLYLDKTKNKNKSNINTYIKDNCTAEFNNRLSPIIEESEHEEFFVETPKHNETSKINTETVSSECNSSKSLLLTNFEDQISDTKSEESPLIVSTSNTHHIETTSKEKRKKRKERNKKEDVSFKKYNTRKTRQDENKEIQDDDTSVSSKDEEITHKRSRRRKDKIKSKIDNKLETDTVDIYNSNNQLRNKSISIEVENEEQIEKNKRLRSKSDTNTTEDLQSGSHKRIKNISEESITEEIVENLDSNNSHYKKSRQKAENIEKTAPEIIEEPIEYHRRLRQKPESLVTNKSNEEILGIHKRSRYKIDISEKGTTDVDEELQENHRHTRYKSVLLEDNSDIRNTCENPKKSGNKLEVFVKLSKCDIVDETSEISTRTKQISENDEIVSSTTQKEKNMHHKREKRDKKKSTSHVTEKFKAVMGSNCKVKIIKENVDTSIDSNSFDEYSDNQINSNIIHNTSSNEDDMFLSEVSSDGIHDRSIRRRDVCTTPLHIIDDNTILDEGLTEEMNLAEINELNSASYGEVLNMTIGRLPHGDSGGVSPQSDRFEIVDGASDVGTHCDDLDNIQVTVIEQTIVYRAKEHNSCSDFNKGVGEYMVNVAPKTIVPAVSNSVFEQFVTEQSTPQDDPVDNVTKTSTQLSDSLQDLHLNDNDLDADPLIYSASLNSNNTQMQYQDNRSDVSVEESSPDVESDLVYDFTDYLTKYKEQKQSQEVMCGDSIACKERKRKNGSETLKSFESYKPAKLQRVETCEELPPPKLYSSKKTERPAANRVYSKSRTKVGRWEKYLMKNFKFDSEDLNKLDARIVVTKLDSLPVDCIDNVTERRKVPVKKVVQPNPKPVIVQEEQMKPAASEAVAEDLLKLLMLTGSSTIIERQDYTKSINQDSQTLRARIERRPTSSTRVKFAIDTPNNKSSISDTKAVKRRGSTVSPEMDILYSNLDSLSLNSSSDGNNIGNIYNDKINCTTDATMCVACQTAAVNSIYPNEKIANVPLNSSPNLPENSNAAYSCGIITKGCNLLSNNECPSTLCVDITKSPNIHIPLPSDIQIAYWDNININGSSNNNLISPCEDQIAQNLHADCNILDIESIYRNSCYESPCTSPEHETHLPIKKRRVSSLKAISKDDARQDNLTDLREEISYPSTPMISIAELENIKAPPVIKFKTPAQLKEIPPLTQPMSSRLPPPYASCSPSQVPPPPLIHYPQCINGPLDTIVQIEPPLSINHTYNNPTINYHIGSSPLVNLCYPSAPAAYSTMINPILMTHDSKDTNHWGHPYYGTVIPPSTKEAKKKGPRNARNKEAPTVKRTRRSRIN